jgi:hypothetical protein
MYGKMKPEAKKAKKPPQVAIMVVTAPKAMPARGARTATNKAKKAK